MTSAARHRCAWLVVLALAAGTRLWNALAMPVMRGYDATGHIAYALFLDLYRAVPLADQGWSYFHPPLHYLFGWLLAQAGSAQVLVRGLALVASVASLAIAGLAAYVVRLALPGRPAAPFVAFLAVTFVPVHVYSSGMPGNELTSACFSSAAVALFLRNEVREPPTMSGAAWVGLFVGLALLTKFSGLLCLLVIVAALLLRGEEALGSRLRRAVWIVGIAVVVSMPYYARNVAEFGVPFQLSRELPLVAGVEDVQPPGERGLSDFFYFPARVFSDPDPEAEHLLHSIWGSVYVNAWSDARPGVERPLARTLVAVGMIPTLLALFGFLLALARALQKRALVDGTLVLLTLAGFSALAIMAYRVPTFAMLKASYLLPTSLAYGFFVARGAEGLGRRSRGVAFALLAAASALSALVFTPGPLRPIGGENERMAQVHSYFGSADRAAEIYRVRIPEMNRPARRTWMRENLAGALVERGELAEASRVYDARKRVFGAPPHLEAIHSPWLLNRRAVAAALAGSPAHAAELLDAAIAQGAGAPPLVNRAALRALAGDLEGASADLDAALAIEPELAAAVAVRGYLEAERGEVQRAREVRAEAARLSRLAPRGFPYGIGNGFHLNGQRFMLAIEDGVLRLYRPGRSRLPGSDPGSIQ